MPPRGFQQEQMHRLEQIVFPHYMQWSMYAVAIKQGAFLPMKAITSLSAKRDSHDISVKTPNTYGDNLQLTWNEENTHYQSLRLLNETTF